MFYEGGTADKDQGLRTKELVDVATGVGVVGRRSSPARWVGRVSGEVRGDLGALQRGIHETKVEGFCTYSYLPGRTRI